MGFLSVQHTVAVSNAIELSSQSVGDSTLLALSAIVLIDTLAATDIWVEIGLLSGGDTADQRSAILSSGYAGTLNSVFWTGWIPTGPDARIYIRLMGTVGETIRLSGLVTDNPSRDSVGRTRAV